MDTQMRKGLLEACVLASLKNGESYGYQIMKDVNTVINISESTLYPILKRLEQQKSLTSRKAEHNGRLRKYYCITDKGKLKIMEFCSEWSYVTKAYNYIKGEQNG